MAVGERCPACGHMAGVEDPHWAAQRAEKLIDLAVELTRPLLTAADSPEQVAMKLATLHGALIGLTFAKQTDEPPA